MGMSTTAVGFRPADEKWIKMKAVWEQCESLGVSIPAEVCDFFGGEPPRDKPGVEVDLGDSCSEYNDESSQGFEIDISKLPANVQFIRVYNSW